MIYQIKDVEGTVIDGGISGIPAVSLFTVVSGHWTHITTAVDTLNIILQPRDEVTWFFATSSGGNYFSIRNGSALQSRFVSVSGSSVGWASSNFNTTMELMQGR